MNRAKNVIVSLCVFLSVYYTNLLRIAHRQQALDFNFSTLY